MRVHGTEKQKEGEAVPSEPRRPLKTQNNSKEAEGRRVGFGERLQPPSRGDAAPFSLLL